MFDNPTQSPLDSLCSVAPCRPDLELQFKCYHHEDRQMNTNWPASVQVISISIFFVVVAFLSELFLRITECVVV